MNWKPVGFGVAILACLGVSLLNAEETLVIEPMAGSELTKSGLTALNQALLGYPMDIQVPNSASIIVRAGHLEATALDVKRIDAPLFGVYDAIQWGRSQVHLTNGHVGCVVVRISTNAMDQINRTIVYSYMSHGFSSRPSTWNGTNVCSVAPVDFLGHYIGGSSIKLMCSFQNLGLEVNSADPNPQQALSSKETEVLANRILALLFSPSLVERESHESKVLQAQYRRQSQSSATISWTAGASLKDHWIRMDVDSGSLTILEDGRVLLEDLPREGTRVHCLAISPEGKRVSETTLYIQ